jgi:K+-transporting ATPase c subunit
MVTIAGPDIATERGNLPQSPMHHARHKAFLRFTAVFAALAGVLLALVFALSRTISRETAHQQIALPDEKAVAAGLLARQFTGPGYFHLERSNTKLPLGAGTDAWHITSTDALSQVERIAAERHLGPGDVTNLNALIGRLTEAPRSRVVGQAEVNVLRLNLALDEAVAVRP